MKLKNNKIFKSLLIVSVSFVLLACSNLVSGNSSENTSTDNSSSNKVQTITITGAITISEEFLTSAALPAEYLSERAAFPDIPTSGYYATATATGKTPINVTPATNNGVTTFTMAIPVDDTPTTWTIEAGIKTTINGSEAVLLNATYTDTFSNTNPSFSHDFNIKPLESGSGDIDLDLSYTTSTEYTPTTLVLYLNGEEITADENAGEIISKSKITLKNRQAGIYKAELVFKKSGYVIFTDYQSITVFPNMTTSKWIYSGGGSSSPIPSNNVNHTYTIKDDLVKAFLLTQIYVGNTKIGDTQITAGENGNGTVFAPYNTFAKAIDYIKDNGDTEKDYTIWISGEITGPHTIQDETGSPARPVKANSITLTGFNNDNTKDKLKGGSSGTVLFLDTDVPVKLSKLTITGGKGKDVSGTLYGGGIYINKGSVELTTGAVVNGNTADIGGGIFLNEGNLYINDTAVVGNPDATECAKNENGKYGNKATSKGGGIGILSGTLHIGYKPGTSIQEADTTGGVFYNLVVNSTETHGGGIDNDKGIINFTHGYIKYNYVCGTGTGDEDVGSGGGIATAYKLNMSGDAQISNNKSAYGGAVYITKDGSYHGNFSMSGGTITANQAEEQHEKYGDGGGVAIGLDGTFTLSGGTISSNTVDRSGGAVFHHGASFEITGTTATIPAGENDSNDIAFYSKDFKIKVSGSTGHTGDGAIAITPAEWKRGFQIFTTDSTSTYFNKFKLTDSEWSIVAYDDGTNTTGVINADIYVSDSGNDDNIGTSSHPLKTIAKAAKVCCPCETEIKVVGTFTASAASDLQSIPNSNEISVSSITLTGTGSGATINANSKGSAFTINKAILVNIENITLKGGNTSSNGAGLNVAVSGAKVNLGNNVVIRENKATYNGGGVYVASGAILCLNGSSIIGNSGGNRPANTSVEPNSSNGINKANYGGGIYCSGTLGIGKSVNSSGTLSNSSFSGGIYTNLSVSHGGGIYLANTSTLSTNGSYIISKNRAGDFGAGIYYASTNALSLSSATFTNNEARGGGAIIIPIGNNIDITVSGGTYTSNSATNGAGGAIHSESTGLLKLEGSVSFTSNTGYDVYGGGAFSHMGSIVFNSTNISIPYGGSKGSNGVWVASGKYIELKQVLSNHDSTNQIGINGTVDNQVLGGSKLNENIEKFKIADDGYYIDTSGYMRANPVSVSAADFTSVDSFDDYMSDMTMDGTSYQSASLAAMEGKTILFYADDYGGGVEVYFAITFSEINGTRFHMCLNAYYNGESYPYDDDYDLSDYFDDDNSIWIDIYNGLNSGEDAGGGGIIYIDCDSPYRVYTSRMGEPGHSGWFVTN